MLIHRWQIILIIVHYQVNSKRFLMMTMTMMIVIVIVTKADSDNDDAVEVDDSEIVNTTTSDSTLEIESQNLEEIENLEEELFENLPTDSSFYSISKDEAQKYSSLSVSIIKLEREYQTLNKAYKMDVKEAKKVDKLKPLKSKRLTFVENIYLKLKDRFKKCNVNLCRMKYLNEFLHAVFQYIKIDAAFSDTIFQENALLQLIDYIATKMFYLAVEPYAQLVCHRNIVSSYENLPMLVRLLSNGGKPNIVKHSFTLISQLIHMKELRPDLLYILFHKGKVTN